MPGHLSDMERKAIMESRSQLAKALEKHHLMSAFYDCPPEVIDDIIGSVWEGIRHSMQMQNIRNEGPPF